MKHSRTLAPLLAVLMLAGGLSLTTSAWARPPGPGFDRMGRFEEGLESLGLDDQTRTAIHTTLGTARAEQRDLRRQLHEAHQNLRTLLAQDAPDEATVLAQSEVIGTLETEHRKQTLRTLLAVRALLTPEQRTSLRQAMREHAWKPAPGR